MQDTTPMMTSTIEEEYKGGRNGEFQDEKGFNKDIEHIKIVGATTNTPQLGPRIKSYHVKTKSLSDLNKSSSG